MKTNFTKFLLFLLIAIITQSVNAQTIQKKSSAYQKVAAAIDCDGNGIADVADSLIY